MKTQTTIRIEESKYFQAKDILKKIGLTYSQAISIFNNMIVMKQGIPFDVKIPNQNTLKALDELDTSKGQQFSSINELFDDLEK